MNKSCEKTVAEVFGGKIRVVDLPEIMRLWKKTESEELGIGAKMIIFGMEDCRDVGRCALS